MTAFHEAGHALVAWSLPHADKVHKISIVARGAMGGYTRLIPDEDRHLWTKNQFEDMLATALGGRVAEQLVFDSGIPYTVLRPSLLFGEGDEFMNALAGLIRTTPLVPVLGNGKNEFQPVLVEDVARCVVNAIDTPRLQNRRVEIGGPQRLTYDQIVDEVAFTMAAKRLKLHIPVALMRFPVWLTEKLFSKPPVTQDQLAMLQVPNYPESDTIQGVFRFSPKPVRGNIDYVRRVTWGDGFKMLLGRMPRHIRDH
jgi:nucleoside-diphosphate-sugar epimerase